MFETFHHVLSAILDQRNELVRGGHYGPFKVLVDPTKQALLLEPYYAPAMSEVTLRDRIAQVEGVVIIKVEPVDTGLGFKVVPHG